MTSSMLVVMSCVAMAGSRRVLEATKEGSTILTSSGDDEQANASSHYPSRCGVFQSCCCYLKDFSPGEYPTSPQDKLDSCQCVPGSCRGSGWESMYDTAHYCPKLLGSAKLEAAHQLAQPWAQEAEAWEKRLLQRGEILDGLDAAFDSAVNGHWWDRWIARVHIPLRERVIAARDDAAGVLDKVEQKIGDSEVAISEDLEQELTSVARRTASAVADAQGASEDEDQGSDANGLVATLRNLTSCLTSSECRNQGSHGTWMPSMHIVGYSTWSTPRGVHGNERVADFSTLEVAEFRYRGVNLGTQFLSLGGNLYSGFGWKGKKHDHALADAYSGPFLSFTGGVDVVPILSGIGPGVSVGMSANDKHLPQPHEVKSVTYSFGGSILKAIPGSISANGVVTRFDYMRGQCFASASDFFSFLWRGSDNSRSSGLQQLRNLNPLVWLQRLVYTLFYLLHRHSAKPQCSEYAKRSWIEGPATIAARLRHFSDVNAQAALELETNLLSVQATEIKKRCCCDTDNGADEKICRHVVPKPNGHCPVIDLGRGRSQTHFANRSHSSCEEEASESDAGGANATSWTFEDLAGKFVTGLQTTADAESTLATFRNYAECSKGRGDLGDSGTDCSYWRPMLQCQARETCNAGVCECAKDSCYVPFESRCLPIGRDNVAMTLKQMASQQQADAWAVDQLLKDPRCAQQQQVHELYCKEKNLLPSFSSKNVCL